MNFIKLLMIALILVATMPSKNAWGTDPIYVLVAQSPLAFGDENVITLASRIENAINSALVKTGFNSQRRVIVHPYYVPTTFIDDAFLGPDAATDIALTWLELKSDSQLSEMRDTVVPLYNAGYDLIVMQIDSVNPNSPDELLVCGKARRMPDLDDPENSETAAFIVIDNHPACTGVFADYVYAHEFSHALGGEHQVAGGANPDNNPDNPVDYNHPVYEEFSEVLLAHTLTASPGEDLSTSTIHHQYSRFPTNETLGQTGISAGAVDKNIFALFVNETWDRVAAYRPLPPEPVACNIDILYCSNGHPQTVVTAFWPGQTLANVDLDYQRFPNSPWLPIYEGNPSCANYNTPIDPSWVRAIVENILGEITSCTVSVMPDECGDDDEIF